ncbi:MAG: 2-phospho-L-lactate transferase [Actinomycetota bacterium]|nr:2-phospho-L-lactate transferase [Actinomycetota bacterium]
MEVTAVAGGVGGSKLLVGLQQAQPDGSLTAVVNTADDAVIYGVHVSPDVDIVTYWLAGLADTARGWGLEADTFNVVGAFERLGLDTWFGLGDADLATCLFRTTRMAEGATLSAVTDEIRRALGVTTTIIPMSDDPVRTRMVCGDGRTLDFQDYFVKERQQPAVKDVRFAGIADAKPAPGVIEAIRDADRVVLCPSNPVVSVGPILALSGVREALREHPDVVAVSPIVAGRPIKGPADKLLPVLGAEVTAAGVATLYRDFCNTFVVDSVDRQELALVEELGMRAIAVDTIMSDSESSLRLAQDLLALQP